MDLRVRLSRGFCPQIPSASNVAGARMGSNSVMQCLRQGPTTDPSPLSPSGGCISCRPTPWQRIRTPNLEFSAGVTSARIWWPTRESTRWIAIAVAEEAGIGFSLPKRRQPENVPSGVSASRWLIDLCRPYCPYTPAALKSPAFTIESWSKITWRRNAALT
jgi:hypothetical protein